METSDTEWLAELGENGWALLVGVMAGHAFMATDRLRGLEEVAQLSFDAHMRLANYHIDLMRAQRTAIAKLSIEDRITWMSAFQKSMDEPKKADDDPTPAK